MHLTVTSVSTDAVFALDITEDMEIENVKAFCEAESSIPAKDITLLFNGKTLSEDKKSIADYGIKDGDMIVMERKIKRKTQTDTRPATAGGGGGLQLPDFSAIQVPGSRGNPVAGPSKKSKEDDPQYIKEMLMKNPDQMGMLRHNNPRLAEALDSDNFEEFKKVGFFFFFCCGGGRNFSFFFFSHQSHTHSRFFVSNKRPALSVNASASEC